MATAQLRLIVTRVIDPFNFWAHIGTDASLAQFNEFEESVNTCGDAADSRCQHCDHLRLSQLVLVKCSTLDRWRRAVVVSIDSEAEEVDVFYVDYSTNEFVPLDSIVDAVPKHFEDFPRQAWKFTLTGVKPIAQTWISRAVSYFTDQVLGQKHDVQLLPMDGSTVVVDILIRAGERQTSLSSMLVNEGFALPVTMNGDRDSKKGSSVPTFDLQSLASQSTPKRDDDDEAESDSDQPNIEQELFAKGVDCSTLGTYSGCSDLDLIAGVPRSPCDTIGNIHSQIEFMRENNEKLAQSKEIRSPQRHQRSKDSDKASAPKPGKPRGVEGGKKSTYIYPPRRRIRMKGLGKDYESQGSEKGSDDHHTSSSPLPQGKHHSPGPLNQGNLHTSSPIRPANHHESSDPKNQGNRHPSRNPLRQGSHPQTRGGNFGDGDGIHRKSLPKSKSPARLGSVKDKEKAMEKVATAPTREQLQNEYDWQSSQFTFKVDKILEDVTEETCTTKSRELHKLLSTVSPQLLNLPGDGALYLSLDTIVRTAITDKISCDIAVKLVESLSGFEEIPAILRKILVKFHGSVIKVTTAAKTKLQCRNFVFFLAMLFNRVSRWEDSDTVTDYIISSLNKWAVFNTKATHSDCRGMSELFSECLCDFIGVSGVALERSFPNDHETLFKFITEKVLSNDVARSVKENMLQLLINQQQTTRVMQGIDTNGVTMETVPVAMTTKTTQTEEPEQVKMADSAIQVELLPCDGASRDQSAPRRTSCSSEVDSVKSGDPDPYDRVKVMLSDLRLEELLDVFLSNAVRDSVLDVEFADLKDLLKECGVRPGELLEIKTYLAKKAKCQACDDTASGTVGARNNNVDVWTGDATAYSVLRSIVSTPLPQATTVLISPEDFVRPRSADDFYTNSQPLAAEAVPPLPHPVVPVVMATAVEQSQKRCSVQPGFGVDVVVAHKHMDDMAFSDDDSVESFDDADKDVSHDRWRDDALRRQLPACSDVTNTGASHDTGGVTTVGATHGKDTVTQPADFVQDDSDVPSSWLDRDDALVVPDLPKPQNKPERTYKRKYYFSSIKNMVENLLNPNNSSPNPDAAPQSDSGKPHQGDTRRNSWGHVTIPTNQTSGTSTAESASPDSTDWPSVTEAQAMPKGKAAPLGSSGPGSRRKKPSSFPREEDRDEVSMEAIKHSFGSCQKRVCTLCGSENHLIYDCPRGTRSLFFN